MQPPPAQPDAATEPDGLLSVGDINILVIDDEAAICKIVQKSLADTTFTVDAVSDPTKVEAQLQAKPYHVIILDYVIPGLDTEQILAWIQEQQASAGIIVVTAYPSIDSALSCLRARTFDYLTKPFQIEDLKRIVTRCLESKGLLRMSEDALREALGNAIRERRKSQSMTLAQLAQRANVSLGYLSQIELGKNSASIETLYRISLGLGIKMSELFQSVRMH